MNSWLCISSDYNSIQLILCSAERVIESHAIDKKNGNQRLLSDMDILLKKHNLTYAELSFIGINVGPAPYTGLRIAIATANGLHAATGIPLVSIDALKAFVECYKPKSPKHATVAILNAFNNDLFYAITIDHTSTEFGYAQSEKLLDRIARELKDFRIQWLGNGTALYTDKIENLEHTTPDYPSAQQFAAYGWQQWLQNNTTKQASPLYLKQIS